MSGIVPLASSFADYLHDESRLTGRADSISFPETEEEAAAQLCELLRAKTPVTVQGSRTGICGAAVPEGGHIMNLSRLNRFTGLRRNDRGEFLLSVQPGLSLAEINSRLRLRSFDTQGWDEESLRCLEALRKAPPQRFAPNPTEDTASIGGAFACNARGLNEMAFGPVGKGVCALSLVLPDGRRWQLKRGDFVSDREGYPLPGGERLAVKAPDGPEGFPSLSSESGTDLIDLFSGSEGMLGTVLNLSLQLSPVPQEQWGMCFFLEDWEAAADFALDIARTAFDSVCVTALEFLDGATLEHIRRAAATVERIRRLPAIPPKAAAAVYVELEGEEEDSLAEAVALISALFEEKGGRDENTWFYEGEEELAKLRTFRHAAPEAVNMAVDEAKLADDSVSKLCLDITLPSGQRKTMLETYEQDIARSGMTGTVFGHMGTGRLHVNLIPKNRDQMVLGRVLMRRWAEIAAGFGAVLAGENGIGKQKKYLLTLCGAERIREARTIKNFFDPEGLLNPGNMFNDGD